MSNCPSITNLFVTKGRMDILSMCNGLSCWQSKTLNKPTHSFFVINVIFQLVFTQPFLQKCSKNIRISKSLPYYTCRIQRSAIFIDVPKELLILATHYNERKDPKDPSNCGGQKRSHLKQVFLKFKTCTNLMNVQSVIKPLLQATRKQG